MLHHRLYNDYHQTRQAQFFLFDCEDDPAAATALFDQASDWARSRKLTKLIGPKGFSMLDGFGVLIDGFAQRQTMSFTQYNYPYYQALVENAGFDKEVDFVSCGLETISFQLPAWLSGLAERARQKVALEIHSCATMPEMVAAGYEVLQTYNRAFTQNWEYYPLPDAEIKWVIENLKPVAIPRLMKIIRHQGQTVGFLLALPDLSAPLQRAKGRLHPWNIIDLLLEKRRMHEIVLVIVAIVEQFQLQAGNALMMLEMEKTMRTLGIRRAELINIAESATQMRRDMTTLGLKPYKTHRVYRKEW